MKQPYLPDTKIHLAQRTNSNRLIIHPDPGIPETLVCLTYKEARNLHISIADEIILLLTFNGDLPNDFAHSEGDSPLMIISVKAENLDIPIGAVPICLSWKSWQKIINCNK